MNGCGGFKASHRGSTRLTVLFFWLVAGLVREWCNGIQGDHRGGGPRRVVWSVTRLVATPARAEGCGGRAGVGEAAGGRGQLTRGLLDNAHHEGIRVDGIMHVSMKQWIPNMRRERFTQVWSPRWGKTLTHACLILIMGEIDYNGADDRLRGGDLAGRQGF
jgi:hypothetical protein